MTDVAPLTERHRFTLEALADPRVGDRFHEMFSFLVVVYGVTETHVEYGTSNRNRPARETATHEEWRTRWLYGGTSPVAHLPTFSLLERGKPPAATKEADRG